MLRRDMFKATVGIMAGTLLQNTVKASNQIESVKNEEISGLLLKDFSGTLKKIFTEKYDKIKKKGLANLNLFAGIYDDFSKINRCGTISWYYIFMYDDIYSGGEIDISISDAMKVSRSDQLLVENNLRHQFNNQTVVKAVREKYKKYHVTHPELWIIKDREDNPFIGLIDNMNEVVVRIFEETCR